MRRGGGKVETVVKGLPGAWTVGTRGEGGEIAVVTARSSQLHNNDKDMIQSRLGTFTADTF